VTLVKLPPPPSVALPDLPAAEIAGLYVHVPFCRHKCHYCDFYSITRQTPQRMERFVSLILREAELWSEDRAPHLSARPQTVFFGGGTPSLLPADLMAHLITGLRARFDLSRVEEWTVECNPATVSDDYCRMLRSRGVDRLSFGAQSFVPGELAVLERHHDPEDVPRSVQIARAAGFARINVDLIYAIPGQDLEAWSASLEQAIQLGTRHLSCYGLTYEANTALAVRRRMGSVRAVEEETELKMLRHTRRRLTGAGLPPYEISNYAAPGEECRHNLTYWTGGNYVGLGPSAASHVSGHRWRNRPHLREWEQSIEQDTLAAIEYEVLAPPRRGAELIMLMLRLARSLRFDDFTARTGLDARTLFARQLDELTRAGLLVRDEMGFGLTSRGIELADAVAGEFLAGQSD
jgi:oxygen-independent coproporphyrinogen-3 oxidase